MKHSVLLKYFQFAIQFTRKKVFVTQFTKSAISTRKGRRQGGNYDGLMRLYSYKQFYVTYFVIIKVQ